MTKNWHILLNSPKNAVAPLPESFAESAFQHMLSKMTLAKYDDLHSWLQILGSSESRNRCPAGETFEGGYLKLDEHIKKHQKSRK